MMSDIPPEIRWENSVSEFIDRLIDSDIRYIDIQEAIERLVQSGQRERIAMPFAEIEGETVYWHPMPTLFPGMFPLHVFWTVEADGGLTVIHAEFRQAGLP